MKTNWSVGKMRNPFRNPHKEELWGAFGQLDIYYAQVRNTERDHTELRAAIIERCDQAVANAPSARSLASVGLEPDPDARPTKEAYRQEWEEIKFDLVEDDIQERSDAIDPLTGDQQAEIESEVREDWNPGTGDSDEPESAAAPTDAFDVELVGEITEPSTRARAHWYDSINDQLEVVTDNELSTEAGGDVLVDAASPSLPPELTVDDVGPATEVNLVELGLIEPEPWTAGSKLGTNPELGADEQQVDAPELATELDLDPFDKESEAQQVDTGSDLAPESPGITEPGVAPEVEITEQELPGPEPIDASELELEATDQDPNPEPDPAESVPQQSSWLQSLRSQCREAKDNIAQFTKDWVDELRSGRHRQCHGTWQAAGIFGKKECTLQVAMNEFDVTTDQLREKYGNEFVSEILQRNDREFHSFDRIASFIERTQLREHGREFER